MMLGWTRERPIVEGWYFWKKAKTTRQEYWHVYYLRDTGTAGRFDWHFYEGGKEVEEPQTGGWWGKISWFHSRYPR